MCVRAVRSRVVFVILALTVGVIAAADASAQEVLRVYGPSGPSPAIRDAAAGFEIANNVKVEIASGPIDTWRAEAIASADLIYSSAQFMMSDFVRDQELAIHEASVRSLYLRPSVMLVRPGNPKELQDLPDLLKPGVRVMVVSGSGQTGLWEDMAGKVGNVQTLRSLRENIVFFAENSDQAMRAWKERDDIDAWITWNIWYMPLRHHARMIPVSRNYRIYRQCAIALTQRGRDKPAAAQFIEFLTSPEGARIFESWGWMAPAPDRSPLIVHTDVCAVCRIDSDKWKDGIGWGLACVRRLLENYEAIGVASQELHFSAVFHGKAAYWMLKDTPYAAFTGKPEPNPNKSVIAHLVNLGVSVELCAETMKEHGWQKEDILPGVRIVPGAYPRIVDLELQGYAYIRF